MSLGHEPPYLLAPILERCCPFARHILLVMFHHVWTMINYTFCIYFASDSLSLEILWPFAQISQAVRLCIISSWCQTLSTLANGSKKMALQSEYVSRKDFFTKNPCNFWCSSLVCLKRHFDIGNNCGDSDLVMLSPIYVSVIPPWLRLCIEAK